MYFDNRLIYRRIRLDSNYGSRFVTIYAFETKKQYSFNPICGKRIETDKIIKQFSILLRLGVRFAF
jgi:hypothetical protein